MKATKSLEIKSAIITLKQLNDSNLIVMDQNGILRSLDISQYKTVSGFKTNIIQERSWGSHMSVGASGKYASCVIPNSSKAAVYDIQRKKLLYTITGHKGDIESICVDDNDHYIVTGGTDGKTYIYNLETRGLVYSFPPHADYITTLEINSIWAVAASYDKTISVLNLSTMQTPKRLIGHSCAVIKMRLLSNMRLLSADKEGNILLWNLKTSKLLQRFKNLNDDVTCLSVSKDDRFLFVGTKLGHVGLYDIENSVLLKRSYIKEETKICSICVLDNSNQIAVGTKSGKLSFYSLLPDQSQMIEQLKSKEYLSLYAAAEENPLLTYSPVYIKLEALWENALAKANQMLEMDQESNAQVVLEPFKGVKSKNALIQSLLLDYKEFNKFKVYVSKKQYSLAYPLVARHKHFQDTNIYRKMENEWHVKFNKAKKYIIDKEGDEKVRILLSDFRGISEKSILIQDLFKQRTAYMLFVKKLSQKDYISIFSLLKKCPFIKEFDEYDKLMEYADSTYIKAQQALDKKDYKKVIEYATDLLHFPEFHEEAAQMIENAEVIKKFTLAFEESKLPSMYKMIGEYPSLMELSEAKDLEDDWNDHLVLAQQYASKADIVNVIASLEDFFEIKAKFLSIALVVQQAYISQLNRALRSSKSTLLIENAIKQYLVFFGDDEHINEFVEAFIEKYESKLELAKLPKGDIKLFRPHMIIPDIVVNR